MIPHSTPPLVSSAATLSLSSSKPKAQQELRNEAPSERDPTVRGLRERLKESATAEWCGKKVTEFSWLAAHKICLPSGGQSY